MSDKVIIRCVQREDGYSEWSIAIHDSVLMAATASPPFLGYVSVNRQLAETETLKALYTISAFVEFAEGVLE